MKIKETFIKDLFVIEPKIYSDKRGYFYESFNKNIFSKKFSKNEFVQDNESKSSRGVLRGLHFQKPPHSQSKLVRCLKGKVLDVAVDIRFGSPTYGSHFSIELSEKNKKQLFIPKGFAHGFLVMSKSAIFAYKVDNFYNPDFESGLLFNDKKLNIDWNINFEEISLSNRDKSWIAFDFFNSPFNYKT